MQRQARWADADRLIKRLDNTILLGHVLEQRYHAPRGPTDRNIVS